MRRALPGSALVHVAVLGTALVGFSWPEGEDAPAAEAVTVNIVAMTSVSANATEVLQSDATLNLVSSGMAASALPTIEPVEPEPVQLLAEPVTALPPEPRTPASTEAISPTSSDEVAPIEPPPLVPVDTRTQPTAVEPQTPDPIQSATEAEPLEITTEVASLNSTAVSSLAAQPPAATPPPALEPLSSEDLKTAPIPQTLSFERTSRPTYPRQPRQQSRPSASQPSQSGNGGANNADAVASAGGAAQQAGSGSGGDAEVARYASQVLGKLRRALRRSNGPRGEVLIRFTVQANGQVSSIGIGRSSGNAAVDQAGLATVNRAAPFPPIPPQANRSTWTFDVPLAFGG